MQQCAVGHERGERETKKRQEERKKERVGKWMKRGYRDYITSLFFHPISADWTITLSLSVRLAKSNIYHFPACMRFLFCLEENNISIHKTVLFILLKKKKKEKITVPRCSC